MKFSDLINSDVASKMKHSSNRHADMNQAQRSKKRSKLSQLRMQNMLTLDEASRLCGVSKGIIRRWETTGMTPNDRMINIKRYAKLLHMNVHKLVEILK